MNIDELFLDVLRLSSGEVIGDRPLALVDLSSNGPLADEISLPPYPVIGIGETSHPLAPVLDAVVEPPVSLSAIVAQVLACPRAAAATVQLLRILPGLSPEAGLTAESMAYAMLQGSAEHKAWLETARGSGAGEGRVLLDRDDAVLTVTLDRPGAGNAIDRGMRDGLDEALALAVADPEIERVVLRGAGKSFCLGAELGEFGTTTDPATAHAIRSLTLPARHAIRCAAKLEARIHGACVGAGLELAAFARRITAARNAWFQLPELSMGIMPGAGGCVSLTRRIGRQRAALMILSGKRLSARQALAWGLIDALMDEPP